MGATTQRGDVASRREAWGLDSGPAPDMWWKPLGVCATNPDAWFAPGSAGWARAAHNCLRHCPVLVQCGAALLREVQADMLAAERGEKRCGRPVDAVMAGVRFNAAGRPRLTTAKSVHCDDRCPR